MRSSTTWAATCVHDGLRIELLVLEKRKGVPLQLFRLREDGERCTACTYVMLQKKLVQGMDESGQGVSTIFPVHSAVPTGQMQHWRRREIGVGLQNRKRTASVYKVE